MADNPDIQWALKLLEPYEEQNLIYKHGFHILTFGVGFAVGMISNLSKKRPAFSGIQQHFIYGALFSGIIGTAYNSYIESKDREKAAVARDYIIRHPEDFIEAPQKKFAECFEPWQPIR